jgi:hypothetical protein
MDLVVVPVELLDVLRMLEKGNEFVHDSMS